MLLISTAVMSQTQMIHYNENSVKTGEKYYSLVECSISISGDLLVSSTKNINSNKTSYTYFTITDKNVISKNGNIIIVYTTLCKAGSKVIYRLFDGEPKAYLIEYENGTYSSLSGPGVKF